MSRLKEGYEQVPQSNGGDYMKLQEGKNKFRVLSEPIVGYEYWNNDNKPSRSRKKLETQPDDVKVGKYGPQFNKYFRAFIVWNYDAEAIQFLSLDKKGILADLENYVMDEDLGKTDPREYDIIVKKEGQGKETNYSLIVLDKKPLDKEIQTEWDKIKANINMDSHFDGGFVLKEAREKVGTESDEDPF